MTTADGGALLLVATVGGMLAMFGLVIVIDRVASAVKEWLTERRKILRFPKRTRVRVGAVLPDAQRGDILPLEPYAKAELKRRLGLLEEGSEPPAAG